MKTYVGWVICVAMLVLAAQGGLAQNAVPVTSTAAASGAAQSKDPKDISREELTATIKQLDAELFDAYNRCDLEKFGSFLPEHLEFYHDQTGGGPMTREQLVGAIKANICGKVHRELVTIEVYPMKSYGAVELGVHRFTHPGIDNDSGTAKFVQLWKYEDRRWWLTRVISYDHGGK
jgi:hypothetical protein